MQSCENGLVCILRAAVGVDDTDDAEVCKLWKRHVPLPRCIEDGALSNTLLY